MTDEPRNAGDIPTLPILGFLAYLAGMNTTRTNFEGYDNSVQRAMPPGTSNTVAIAKMRRLFRSGLVRGYADKHDRGDWELTPKGWTELWEAKNEL